MPGIFLSSKRKWKTDVKSVKISAASHVARTLSVEKHLGTKNCLSVCGLCFPDFALSLSVFRIPSSFAFQFVLAPVTAVYLIHVIVVLIVQVGRMH